MRGFFSELARRRVWRAAGAYLVLAWLIAQISAVVFPALGLPLRAQTAALVSLAILFPVVLALAWKYEFRDGVLRVTREAEPDRPVSAPGRMLELGVIAALCLIVVALVWGRSFSLFGGPAGPPEASVAVLPFLDLSAERNQSHFADGVAEEILNALSQSRDLKVAARTSSFSFRDGAGDVRAIGEALGVANVLEGSIRLSGDTVRVTAQLIEARSGYHLWSETFERSASDIFQVQDEIAEAVRRQLEVALLGGETAAANLEAYELYLKALADIRRATPDAFPSAIAQLERAIEIAPDYAEPYAALAAVLRIMTVSRRGDLSQAEFERRAARLIEQALSIDPDLPEAHVSLAILRIEQSRWDEALAAVDRALALRPNYVRALQYRSEILSAQGRVKDAWESVERARALDPLNPLVVADWANYLPFWGRADEARDALTPFLDHPQYAVPATAYLMGVEYRAGDLARMHAAALLMQSRIGEVQSVKSHKLMIYAHLGMTGQITLDDASAAEDRLYAAIALQDEAAVREAAEALLAADEGGPGEARLLAGAALARIGDCEGARAALAPLYDPAQPGSGPLFETYADARSIDLAFCLMREGRTDEAEALLQAMQAVIAAYRADGMVVPTLDYMEARIHALSGRREAALERLGAAMEGAWPWISPAKDPAFAALRPDSGFKPVQDRFEAGLARQREAVTLQLAQTN